MMPPRLAQPAQALADCKWRLESVRPRFEAGPEFIASEFGMIGLKGGRRTQRVSTVAFVATFS